MSMKTIVAATLAAGMVSCASAESPKPDGGQSKPRVLVVYYSISNGNTKMVAERLQTALDADIARIEPVKPYPPYKGWNCELNDIAQREVQENYCPDIKPLGADIADYDVIAIGTPTWWFCMASPVRTFLTQNDWKGKTVIPFMTHGGWPGHVIKDMKSLCRGASFIESIEVEFDKNGGSTLVSKQKDITEWVERVKKAVQKL